MSLSPSRAAGGRTGTDRAGRPRRAPTGLMILAAASTALPHGLAAQEVVDEASVIVADEVVVDAPAVVIEPLPPEERLPNPLLTFSLSQGLRIERNPDLLPVTSSTEARLVTGLGFGFLSETPIALLEVTATGSLSLALADEDPGLDGPALGLRYERSVPSASLSVSAGLRRDDIETISGLGDFATGDGTVELPADFEDLEGEGVRRSAALAGALTLRDDRPFGIELSASAEAVDYEDVTAEDLADFWRIDAAARFRFDVNAVTQVRAGLRGSILDEDGEERETTLGADLEGTVERPDGSVFARLSLEESEDGLIGTISAGRFLERPLGTISGELGLTRDADGDLFLTGRADVSREFVNGTLAASLGQSVGSDDDEEELTTTLSVAWTQEIAPLTGLSIDALYNDVRGLDIDEEERDIELGVTLTRQITSDWSLAVSYRHRRSDESGTGWVSGDSLFVGLSRSFQGSL